MAATLTARALYDAYQERFALQWVAGHAGQHRAIHQESGDGDAVPSAALIVGHLNLIRPYQIQILGGTELDFLHGLGKNSRQDAVLRLFSEPTSVVIVTDGKPIPEDLHQASAAAATPLLCSALPSGQLVSRLQHALSAALAGHATVHGVFMEVTGIGVLLTGDSGIGKSELALELITRGHRLIADDAPEFRRVAPDTLSGVCPAPLRDFLEVRGLGMLNIRALFGDSAIKHNKNLRLIVHLEVMDERQFSTIDRLHGQRRHRAVLGVDIPQVTLPVIPGLNLAVLVECAVRNHILFLQGYNAGVDFIERQQQYIDQGSP